MFSDNGNSIWQFEHFLLLSFQSNTKLTTQNLVFSCILSSYHEKAIKALPRARLGVSICLLHPNEVISLSAFTNGTTSKLAALFSTLSL